MHFLCFQTLPHGMVMHMHNLTPSETVCSARSQYCCRGCYQEHSEYFLVYVFALSLSASCSQVGTCMVVSWHCQLPPTRQRCCSLGCNTAAHGRR